MIILMLVVGIGTFMSALDSSAVNLAMPKIRSDFGVSLSMVEWIVTSYLLVVSSLLLTFGRLSDLYGHKRMYVTGFVIFTFGSLLCGLSVHVVMLIACRVVQGLGAGMLFATGPAIITNNVPPASRGKALSVTAIAVALGLCAGPVIGGTFTTLFDWQSIFFINVPIGIFGIAMAFLKIPADQKQTAPVSFDKIGGALIFFALLLILLPLSLSGDYALPPALFSALLAGGILLAGIFIGVERRSKSPMLNLKLFHNRVFAASSAAALLTYMAQFMLVFLTPFYLQNLRGYSAFVSGLLYLPLPVATLLVAPVSGAISDRFDSRFISSAGMLVMAAGLFSLSFLKPDTSNAYIVTCMFLTGVGFGMFQTPNNSAIMGNAPREYRGTASGTLATTRNIGMSVGVAVSGALFSAVSGRAKTQLALQGLTGAALTQTAFIRALQFTFLAAALVALLSMTASLVKGKVKTELEKRREQTEENGAS